MSAPSGIDRDTFDTGTFPDEAIRAAALDQGMNLAPESMEPGSMEAVRANLMLLRERSLALAAAASRLGRKREQEGA